MQNQYRLGIDAGGTFTDWQDVPDWAEIGFPVGECHADGTVVITVPDGTGALVSIGTVAEQLLYEVSDPQAYIVPDVVCDFSGITLEQVGPNRVRVAGAKGYPATDSLKACATFDAGWRSVALIPVTGIDAVAKAERQAEALLQRSGARQVAWYSTEASPNTFPRLPVRAGEHVLLGLALFGDAAALQSFANSGAWARDVAPGLAPWLARAPETHRLQPTARSALHA